MQRIVEAVQAFETVDDIQGGTVMVQTAVSGRQEPQSRPPSDLLQQAHHLDRRQSCIIPLVANFAAGAVERLIHGLAGDDSERYRDAGFASDAHDAGRDLAVDVLMMTRRALDDSSQADNC